MIRIKYNRYQPKPSSNYHHYLLSTNQYLETQIAAEASLVVYIKYSQLSMKSSKEKVVLFFFNQLKLYSSGFQIEVDIPLLCTKTQLGGLQADNDCIIGNVYSNYRIRDEVEQ